MIAEFIINLESNYRYFQMAQRAGGASVYGTLPAPSVIWERVIGFKVLLPLSIILPLQLTCSGVMDCCCLNFSEMDFCSVFARLTYIIQSPVCPLSHSSIVFC